MVSMGAILRKLAIENHLAVLVPFFLLLCQSLCEWLSSSSHWSSSGQYQMLGTHCAWLGADGSCETSEVPCYGHYCDQNVSQCLFIVFDI
jgi:hypothetical protein